jgi:LysR family transcriptional regulator for metE and metH
MRHLQLVRAIAEAGSLTQAGIALHLTQSALSHQLRDIESRLGAKLFSRAGRRLALTTAGETLLKTAHEVIALIERSEDAIRQETDAGRGLLRITTECYTCYHWLPPVLNQYRRSHPHVEVRIDVSATDRPTAALIDGQIDLALVSERPQDRRIAARPLFYDEYVALVHPLHPLAKRAFLRPEDFASETLLTYSPASDSTIYQRLFVPAGVAPAKMMQVRLTEAMIELAKAGLGIGVLSTWAAAPHVAAGTVRAIPLTRGRFGRTWSAAMLKGMAKLPHVVDFVEILIAARPFDMPTTRGTQASISSRPPAAMRRRAPRRR